MDSYCVKLSGTAELPQALEMGKNYNLKLSGSITSITVVDEENGDKTYYYKFRPVMVESTDELGKTIKSKDLRSRSQQLRALIFRKWREENPSELFDIYYDKFMLDIISDIINK